MVGERLIGYQLSVLLDAFSRFTVAIHGTNTDQVIKEKCSTSKFFVFLVIFAAIFCKIWITYIFSFHMNTLDNNSNEKLLRGS